ncbi:unnamed protein product [Adineta ricciae]|uniref:NHL repeat containing protein-like protein n=1 Tax=Adineta ricciae TaxID=249248 RepID=A0A816ELB1_ADIRI|nr:unnamed protein product [Adineta ricciae]
MVVVFLLILINRITTLWFNQPQFCPTVEWSRDAITFVNTSTAGISEGDIFIDANNTIYIAVSQKKQILIWHENTTYPMIIGRDDWSLIFSIFVPNTSEIYISFSDSKIIKWMASTNTFVNITHFQQPCRDIFIDIENHLYCSLYNLAVVVKTSVNGKTPMMIMAGITNIAGSTPDKLYGPSGIFVDRNLDLYVADTWNNRVQLFSSGKNIGKTVAGQSSSDITIALKRPHSTALDADKYLFISDNGNNRIVASGPNGFRCLLGCNGMGKQPHQLNHPMAISFDVHKNVFVYDAANKRFQKFDLQIYSCQNVPVTTRILSYILPS